MHLNILNDSEFLKSVGCGRLYKIESIPHFAVNLKLVNNDLEFLQGYGQYFKKIIIGILRIQIVFKENCRRKFIRSFNV